MIRIETFLSTQFKSIICSHLKLMKWLYEVEHEISFSFNFKSSVKMLVYQFVQSTKIGWELSCVHMICFLPFDKSRRSSYRLKWNWIFFPIWTSLSERRRSYLFKESNQVEMVKMRKSFAFNLKKKMCFRWFASLASREIEYSWKLHLSLIFLLIELWWLRKDLKYFPWRSFVIYTRRRICVDAINPPW